MDDIYTVPEFAKRINRSRAFVSWAIILEKLTAKKVGRMNILTEQQAQEFENDPFQISRRELPWEIKKAKKKMEAQG